MFDFGGITTSTTKQQVNVESSRMIIEDNYNESSQERYVVLLLDRQPNALQLKRLKEIIIRNRISNYTILYSFKPFLTTEQKLPGAVMDFVWKNKNNCIEFINKRKVDAIVPFGQALYLITEETGLGALQPKNFYNYITLRSYFYWNRVPGQTNQNHPITHVFPVDTLGELFPTLETEISKADWQTYKTEFLKKQLGFISNLPEFWTPPLDKIKTIKIKTKEDFDKFIEDHMNSDIVAWDTETTSYDWMTGDFICHTFAFEPDVGYYVDWGISDPVKIIQLLKSCKKLVCANGKYDTKWLWKHAERVVENNKITYREKPGCFYPTDGTDLLLHCIDTSELKGLGPLSWLFTSLGGYWQDLNNYKERAKIKSYADIPTETLEEYAAYDAVATLRAYFALVEHCHKIDRELPNSKDPRYTMWNFYRERVMYSYPHWIDLEYKGVYVNKNYLLETQAKYEKEISDLQEKLLKLWEGKQSFLKEKKDILSTTKLGKAFMEMQFDPVETSLAGIYKTDDAALQVWMRAGRPGIKDLQLLRKLCKCLKTFIGSSSAEIQNAFSEYEEDEIESDSGWLKLLKYHPEDDSYRLHPDHNFMGTATCRDACKNPNLQQLTAKGDFAEPVLRNMWVKNPGKTIMLTADYSSLQARIVLQDTFFNDINKPDQGLWDVYKEGGVDDLHSKSAVGFFETPVNGLAVDIVDEDGKKYTFGGKQLIKIKRGSDYKVLQAQALVETDSICENQQIIVKREGKEKTINATDFSTSDKIISYEV